jgi:nucleoside-diphosphate-sugar epimerase
VKAVVTGAAGFIGSQLTERLLAEGHEVTAIDSFADYYPRKTKERNLAQARAQPGLRFVEGSLNELDLGPALEGADQVYHLAAQAGVRASWGRDFEIYTTNNVLATQRLLEAAVPAGLKRFVYASSSSVYGDAPVLPLHEDTPCRPVSPYGVTKLAAEHLVHLYGRSYGVPVVSLRYFTVYGPRQRPDMAFHRFLSAARDGTPIRVFGDGLQTRDFTFVDDIVSATRAAADSGTPGRVYNVGGGESIPLRDVLKVIEQVTGRRVEAVREDAQKGDMRDTLADTEAARRELGFRSTVALRDGLAREWEWLKAIA